MNLLNFVSEFPDESGCRNKFKEYRERVGVVCPIYGYKAHYWKGDKACYECKHCGKRQSLVYVLIQSCMALIYLFVIGL
jgi:hypothetical protein